MLTVFNSFVASERLSFEAEQLFSLIHSVALLSLIGYQCLQQVPASCEITVTLLSAQLLHVHDFVPYIEVISHFYDSPPFRYTLLIIDKNSGCKF